MRLLDDICFFLNKQENKTVTIHLKHQNMLFLKNFKKNNKDVIKS